MPVTTDDLLTFPSLLVPDNDTDPSGGGIDDSAILTDQYTAALIPTKSVPLTDDEVWRYKAFRKNVHATDSLYLLKAWMRNGLKVDHASGTVAIRSDDPTEVTGKVRVFGFKLGAPWFEDININGTTLVYGGETWDEDSFIRAQRLSAAGVLQAAIGNVSLYRDSLQGVIPQGLMHATGEFELGLDPTVDGTVQAANRLSDPADVAFSLAWNEATSIVGPAVLGPTQAIGFWYRFTRKARLLSPVGYTFPVVMIKGDDAA